MRIERTQLHQHILRPTRHVCQYRIRADYAHPDTSSVLLRTSEHVQSVRTANRNQGDRFLNEFMNSLQTTCPLDSLKTSQHTQILTIYGIFLWNSKICEICEICVTFQEESRGQVFEWILWIHFKNLSDSSPRWPFLLEEVLHELAAYTL